ncbi:DUF3578 domain-containing protein [Olleya sp. Ti.3.14]|uniref:McrB family protein n=1 Tax=Olleya sp. Ti.3.14 TaxID=3121297 RepID=UPI00311E62A7
MNENNFTWVKTHNEITKYLSTKENNQSVLIELLKSVGITPFNDKAKIGSESHDIELNEIDPFTFYCYIYKYGEQRRLYFLQAIAKNIGAQIPNDEKGIPSAQAQKVWLFPYKYDRVNNEISRLWGFFKKALNDKITDLDFSDVLKISSIGKTKLTEALFYIKPEKYLPINGPTKPFIELELGLNPRFNTYSEYITLLKAIKRKTNVPFYELSYKAWEWNEDRKNNKMSNESRYSEQLLSFLEQAKTDNLKTKHYQKAYKETKVRVSFGQGNSAKIPWISFLKEPFTTSDGIYPVYLFYKNINKLILAYGRSETNKPIVEWNINKAQSISRYFEENNFEKPERYGDSYVFRVYDVSKLPNEKILNDDLDEIIEKYSTLGSNESTPEKNNNSMRFDLESFEENCKSSGLTYNSQLITRYIASLATKPFVLLSGLSGSGKTKLAQAFARWIAKDESQYCIVPVGADWTNREPLLGYSNALNDEQYILPENGALKLLIEANKEENNNKPYFLLLDEMNLSHVERYFADFLSVMESKDKLKLHSEGLKNGVPSHISWPSNLFIIGTVNIDETTYMFSPKVLDRANVIEFRVNKTDIAEFLKEPKEIDFTNLDNKGASMGEHFVSITTNKAFPEIDTKILNEKLVLFFEELKKTGAEFGYRTATEIHRLYNQLTTLDIDMQETTKIDIAIMQKLLPKLHGSRRKLFPVLETLASLCVGKDVDASKAFLNNTETIVYNNNADVLYPLSLEKITRMYKGAIDNGFASYAEA